jgi:hypothetical protein
MPTKPIGIVGKISQTAFTKGKRMKNYFEKLVRANFRYGRMQRCRKSKENGKNN